MLFNILFFFFFQTKIFTVLLFVRLTSSTKLTTKFIRNVQFRFSIWDHSLNAIRNICFANAEEEEENEEATINHCRYA